MKKTLFVGFVLVAASLQATGQETPTSTITINGELVEVEWSDGDSFQFLTGPFADNEVRLAGFNALESYGPVHRWGLWTGAELYGVSQQATALAEGGSWNCVTDEQEDHYGRILVTCDDLVLAMAESGFGHLYSIDTTASEAQLLAQQTAQEQRLGMWEKGVPDVIVTSLHSADEGGDSVYNRVISTVDGTSTQLDHSETYQICEEVCVENEVFPEGSCLLYVPFQLRYGPDRAECLR